MTKSTITRERLEELASGQSGFNLRIATLEESQQLASMALAAMDSSESIELPLDYLQGHKDGLEWASQLAEANHPGTGDWLYDDPIELAKAIRKGPDMPPSQPALDTKPVAYTDERNLGYIDRGRETAYLWGKQNSEASDVALYRHAQPVPVVPNEIKHRIGGLDWGWEGEFNRGWNACRAAMLQELKKSAGTEAICRSDENVQVLHTKSPAQNHVSPEQNGDTPAQSQGWIQVSEQMPPSRHEVLVGSWWGEKPRWCCKWATYIPGHPDAQSSGWLIPGASWTPTHWMPLPAAPQPQNSPQNIPEIIPGWIPVSEQKPDCWCLTCRPVTLNDMRFVVCPDCGNKRCPRANDHRNACTGSNEPGQEGSAYPAAPQEVR